MFYRSVGLYNKITSMSEDINNPVICS